jgi:hypothetical protein
MFCYACGRQLPDDAAFCQSCGKAVPSAAAAKSASSDQAAQPARRRFPLFTVIAGVAGLVLVVAIIGTASQKPRPPLPYMPSITLTPTTDRVVSGSITVPAGRHLDFRFDVDPSTMRDARMVGHFLCIGGAGNDIVAVLAEEKEFGKWIDGQVANVYYTSQGKVTTGSLDVSIRRPGTYYLSFSNTFSALTAKTISAEIDLRYSRATVK